MAVYVLGVDRDASDIDGGGTPLANADSVDLNGHILTLDQAKTAAAPYLDITITDGAGGGAIDRNAATHIVMYDCVFDMYLVSDEDYDTASLFSYNHNAGSGILIVWGTVDLAVGLTQWNYVEQWRHDGTVLEAGDTNTRKFVYVQNEPDLHTDVTFTGGLEIKGGEADNYNGYSSAIIFMIDGAYQEMYDEYLPLERKNHTRLAVGLIGQPFGAAPMMTYAEMLECYNAGFWVTVYGNNHESAIALVNNKDALNIQYTGGAAAATMDIVLAVGRAITLTTTTTAGVDDIIVDLTDASYETLADLVAHLNGIANYTCTIVDDADEAAQALNVVTAQDIKTGVYTATFDEYKSDFLAAIIKIKNNLPTIDLTRNMVTKIQPHNYFDDPSVESLYDLAIPHARGFCHGTPPGYHETFDWPVHGCYTALSKATWPLGMILRDYQIGIGFTQADLKADDDFWLSLLAAIAGNRVTALFQHAHQDPAWFLDFLRKFADTNDVWLTNMDFFEHYVASNPSQKTIVLGIPDARYSEPGLPLTSVGRYTLETPDLVAEHMEMYNANMLDVFTNIELRNAVLSGGHPHYEQMGLDIEVGTVIDGAVFGKCSIVNVNTPATISNLHIWVYIGFVVGTTFEQLYIDGMYYTEIAGWADTLIDGGNSLAGGPRTELIINELVEPQCRDPTDFVGYTDASAAADSYIILLHPKVDRDDYGMFVKTDYIDHISRVESDYSQIATHHGFPGFASSDKLRLWSGNLDMDADLTAPNLPGHIIIKNGTILKINVANTVEPTDSEITVETGGELEINGNLVLTRVRITKEAGATITVGATGDLDLSDCYVNGIPIYGGNIDELVDTLTGTVTMTSQHPNDRTLGTFEA